MGLIHSPIVPSDGLVLCLDTANKRSYPGSGTNWFDLSGNNNHGVLTNGPTLNTGPGGGMSFDGVNDYVATTASLNGFSQYSVSFFAKPTATNQRMEVGQGTDSNNRGGYGLAENGLAYSAPGLEGYGYCDWSSLGVSKFIHVVGIFSASGATNVDRATLYLNGAKQTLTFFGTVRSTPLSYTNNLIIGARPQIFGYSQGLIDDIRVYNRVLSDSEIRQLFEFKRRRYS